MRILVLFAHPAMEKSRVNWRLAEAVKGLPNLTFHDLYEAYPDFHIQVRREQDLLREHDVIVFQHPFYWYSGPALLKEWQDLVLEYGFAYGKNGNALWGKITFNAITTGGAQEAYGPEGYNHFTIRQLLAPFEQTANLCGMKYLAPFVVHGSLSLSNDVDVAPHASAYLRVLRALAGRKMDLDRAASAQRLNDALAEES